MSVSWRNRSRSSASAWSGRRFPPPPRPGSRRSALPRVPGLPRPRRSANKTLIREDFPARRGAEGVAEQDRVEDTDGSMRHAETSSLCSGPLPHRGGISCTDILYVRTFDMCVHILATRLSTLRIEAIWNGRGRAARPVLRHRHGGEMQMEPRYAALAREIALDIANGQHPVGSLLPGEWSWPSSAASAGQQYARRCPAAGAGADLAAKRAGTRVEATRPRTDYAPS